MSFTSDKIRDVVLLGHQGSGKTSLAEALYSLSNKKEKGTIEKKNTISDFLKEEQNRLSSTSTAIIPFVYQGTKVNILDVPGNDDFFGEAVAATKMIKGACLVIDATSGVQVGTVKHYKLLKKLGIPTIIFVNKMDKENIKYEKVLDEIRSKLGKECVPFAFPLGHEDKFDGFVDVVRMKARIYNGKEMIDGDVHPDKVAICEDLNNKLCEAVAVTDDALLEKFFAGEKLTTQEVEKGLRDGVHSGEVSPILVGAAIKDVGVRTLLDMIVTYLPTPAELNPFIAKDDKGNTVKRMTVSSEPFSAYVLKTSIDPYIGTISLVKINSGRVQVGDEILCPQTDETFKLSSLFEACGKTQTPITSAEAGDIVLIGKLENIDTGMTLCSPKHVTIYEPIKYPTAVYFQAVTLDNKKDEDKLSSVLNKVKRELQTVEIRRNVETKQLLIGALSSSHLAFILDKIKNTYGIALSTDTPKIVYRESLKGKGSAEGRYVKQSGGSGFYGVVVMEFEPCEEGNKFEERVFGGAVPRNYYPAVEKGFFEAVQQGQLAGFPVIGVKGILLDGKYHAVDSNEMAFKLASIIAFKNAYLKCNPIILEPIMKITVTVDNAFTGAVMNDLNTRRARIQNMEEIGGEQQIVCLVPEAELADYIIKLKTITQGSGTFEREFNSYEEVPSFAKDKIIKENSLLKKED